MLSELAKIVRRNGIGGSDIAPILGCSPWKTALEVYKEKVDGFEREISDEQKLRFANGHTREQRIASLYAEKIQKTNEPSCLNVYHSAEEVCQHAIGEENRAIYIDKQNNAAIYQHPKYHFLLASPDRIVCQEIAFADEWWGLEIKTASWYTRDNWGVSGTDQIPHHYYLQLQHYMLVTGLKRWDLAVLFGDLAKDGMEELRIYSFEYNEEIGQLIVEGAKNFWDNHFMQSFPPPADYNHSSSMQVFKQIYRVFDEKSINLPDEYILVADQRKEAAQRMIQYDAVKDECTNAVLHAMGDATLGLLSDGRAFKRTLTKNGRVLLTLIGGSNEQ
jgi:predicted phage-related endonuclease